MSHVQALFSENPVARPRNEIARFEMPDPERSAKSQPNRLQRVRERKVKGKDLSLKGSLKARMRRDRLLQGHHSLHRRQETDPNPNPNPKHAPHTYHVQSSVTHDCIVYQCIPDPADLDLDEGYSEPDLCFSRSQVRGPAYALLDTGATHVLLPGHMLPKRARSFEVTVNLAVGKEKAGCWRNEVYAEDRAHPRLPLGRLANLLDTKFVWEDGTAVMQCRDKGKWRTMTKFEIRNNMAYASQMQFEVLRRALWVQQAQPQTVFNWQFWERAAQDPKMTSYLTHGVKAKMCETNLSIQSEHIMLLLGLSLNRPVTLYGSKAALR